MKTSADLAMQILEIELTGYNDVLNLTNEKDRTSKEALRENAQKVKKLCREAVEMLDDIRGEASRNEIKVKAVKHLLDKYNNDQIYINDLLERLNIVLK